MAAAPRKIRYASGIEYFEGSLTLPGPGLRELWRDSEDNPMSPTFVPLEARDERGKARWWAAINKRARQHPAVGVFD